jgi:type I restriction enzyme M protein
LGADLAVDDTIFASYDRRATAKLLKQLDQERKSAVEQLKRAAYFHRQAAWLQDRFPEAELQAVPGLVKLVDRKDIEAADWSLTPGRYVGVARSRRTRTSTSSRPCGTFTLNWLT